MTDAISITRRGLMIGSSAVAGVVAATSSAKHALAQGGPTERLPYVGCYTPPGEGIVLYRVNARSGTLLFFLLSRGEHEVCGAASRHEDRCLRPWPRFRRARVRSRAIARQVSGVACLRTLRRRRSRRTWAEGATRAHRRAASNCLQRRRPAAEDARARAEIRRFWPADHPAR
jgi:hypothetical protein